MGQKIGDKILRVLIVDDNKHDAFLVARNLKKGGYDLITETVDTSYAMSEALKSRQWDVIICDYDMPCFSGLAALRILQEQNIDIPFFLVSGVVDENTAVEMMRSGAKDYIGKDNLSRLIPAIERELREAEIRRERSTLEDYFHESEESYRLLMDTAGDAIMIIDQETGIIVEINKKTEEMLRTDKDNIVGMITDQLRIEDDTNEATSLLGTSNGSGQYPLRELYILHEDGSRTVAEVRASVTILRGRRYVQCIFRDITQRKLMEDQLMELNTHLQQKVSEEIEKRRINEQILIQQSKLAAMGEMINAIAHQWRQPLHAVALMVHDIKDAYIYKELDMDYMDNSIKRIMEQLNFMSKTIDDFRTFFKPSKEKTLFDVETAIREIFSLMDTQLKNNNISYSIAALCGGDAPDDVSDKRAFVLGYPNEFKHVVLNLINNARDAISENIKYGLISETDGCIVCSISRMDGKVFIRVEDNGGGITEDIKDKIFNPYFTTKLANKGTGVGLYMAKVIIENNMDGRLTFSNTEAGSAFTIELKEENETP
ncbi:MAG: response regulator [Nitrospirae bacterium]|nr:response regulator [Nitrospirota bacterium]